MTIMGEKVGKVEPKEITAKLKEIIHNEKMRKPAILLNYDK